MITHAPMTRSRAPIAHVTLADVSGFGAATAAEGSGSDGGAAAIDACGGCVVAAGRCAFATDDVDFPFGTVAFVDLLEAAAVTSN